MSPELPSEGDDADWENAASSRLLATEDPGQEPAHQPHVQHGVDRAGGDGAASGGAAHKGVVSKARQRAAKGKDRRAKQFLELFLRVRDLPRYIPPPCGLPPRRPPQR